VFNLVVMGNGPCNRVRVRTRGQAFEAGDCFRDALVAHAEKKAAAKAAA
jgi:ring-1,2-phenylacetyl-CoA epoxidase subunit PaaA